jgi:membrane protein YdbS with pleckstrin-like domain
MPLFSRPKHIPTSKIYPLQYRKIWKKLLVLEISATSQGRKLWRQVFGSLVALGGVYGVVGLMTPTVQSRGLFALLSPLFAMFLALLFLIVLYQWLYICTYLYDVGEQFLKIRKGVLVRREITIPYGRIQDVYVDQDLMDHLLHLYDVYISTATEMSGVEAHIDGLSSGNAQKVRDLILERVAAANAARPNGGV